MDDDELVATWKEMAVSKNLSAETNETTKYLFHDSRCIGRDSKLSPPKYKSGSLTLD
jgi:hypothetical protein